jgi:hypothetical protein
MTSVTQEVQDQMLGAIRKSQEVTLDAVKKVVETVTAAQAKLPAPFDGKIPNLPLTEKLSELPPLSDLPEPEAVVSSAFDFLGQLLAEQRKFATAPDPRVPVRRARRRARRRVRRCGQARSGQAPGRGQARRRVSPVR